MIAPAIPAGEPGRLEALRQREILDTPPEPAFDTLTKLVAKLLDVPISLVSIVDADRQWFKSCYGLQTRETARDISFCGHVVAEDRPLIVVDAAADERFCDNPLVTGPPRIRFYAGFPIRSPDGLVLGTLCAIDVRPRRFEPEVLDLLRLMADIAADQIERRRDLGLITRQRGRLQSILNTAIDAIITIDEHGVVDGLNPAGERLFGFSASELVGQNVRVLMPPPYAEEHDEYLASYLRTGLKKVIGIGREVVARRRDGTTFPAELSVGEVSIRGKRLFTGIVRDVTERHQNLESLRSALATVERTKGDVLAVLDALGVATAVLDDAGRIRFVSDSCLSLMGLDAEEVSGQTLAEALPLDHQHLERLTAAIALPQERRLPVSILVKPSSGRSRQLEAVVYDDPRDDHQRLLVVQDVSELIALRTETSRLAIGRMVGSSLTMGEVFRTIRDVAGGEWTVLIEGETGTGKELVAQAIHSASPRSAKRLVSLNCGGLTESLLSSQLFGHRRGSFTGAVADQEGIFEAAQGGTLLLDEVGEMPLAIQAHLLRVLQEKEIVRVGETRSRKVDVRILAATNRDLDVEAAEGRFRADLLYRIRVARVRVPPLRERREDVPHLSEVFLAEARAAGGKTVRDLTPEALEALSAYRWPGNVRELKSAIEHAVIRCRGDLLDVKDLPREIAEYQQSEASLGAGAPPGREDPPLQAVLDADEKERVVEALRRARGNRQEAARLLGISRATLYRRLRALGLLVGRKPGNGHS